jgi:hypothetical protein
MGNHFLTNKNTDLFAELIFYSYFCNQFKFVINTQKLWIL